MLRPTARNDEDGVNAQVVARAHITRREPLGGGHDAPQPPLVEREARGRVGGTRLHFDEGERSAAPCNHIDLAAAHASTPREDAPAVKTEVPARQGLCAAAALLSGLAVHLA